MKQLTQGIINCVALILVAAGLCQAANQSGALLEIKGTVTGTGDSPATPVDLVVNDGVIHSGVFQKVPLKDPINNPSSTCVASDRIRTDAYVLQAGSPTGCDPGDRYEGNNISPNDGTFSFTQAGSPGYRFDIRTHYECVVGEGGVCSGTPKQNTNSTISSNDTGFLTVTNNGSSTFSGTITLSSNPRTESCLQFRNDVRGETVLTPGSAVVLALSLDSSGCGGFTSDTTVGEIKKVAAGATTNLLPDGPLTQSITFVRGTDMGGVAAMRDVLTLVDGATVCDPKVNGTTSGSEGGNPGNTDLFGGSAVPGSATCAHVSGTKAGIISNECFDVSGNQFPDCKGIEPPPANPVIGLKSKFSNAADPQNPLYVIAEDTVDDFTNVTTSFRPGCTTPPCLPSGGPHHLNGRETVGDANLQCQVFPTFTITPSPVHAGQFITVAGNIGGCNTSDGLLTFTFEGALRSGDDEGEDDGGDEGACRQRRISIPHPPAPGRTQGGSPVGLPTPATPFNVQLKVPIQACPGTFKLSATINAGSNMFYNSSASFTVF